MKPWPLGLRLAIFGALSLVMAACVPGPEVTSITPMPTPAGPARPPTASPTPPPPVPAASPVSTLPTPTASPLSLLPTPTTMSSAPALTLVLMHTNDVRGYTEPCG